MRFRMQKRWALAGVLSLALVSTAAMCNPRTSPRTPAGQVGEYGLLIADSISQIQQSVKTLEQQNIVPTRTALTIQEALLEAGKKGKELVPLLRSLDTISDPAQQAEGLERARVLAHEILGLAIQVSPKIGDRPETAAVLGLLDKVIETVNTLTLEIGKLKGASQ